jgi:hypothetical protein
LSPDEARGFELRKARGDGSGRIVGAEIEVDRDPLGYFPRVRLTLSQRDQYLRRGRREDVGEAGRTMIEKRQAFQLGPQAPVGRIGAKSAGGHLGPRRL